MWSSLMAPQLNFSSAHFIEGFILSSFFLASCTILADFLFWVLLGLEGFLLDFTEFLMVLVW